MRYTAIVKMVVESVDNVSEEPLRPPEGPGGASPGTQGPHRPSRRMARWILLVLALLPLAWFGYAWATFPSDRTPKGAYLRVVKAVNDGKPSEFFAYIEEEAQHASFTIRDYRKQALDIAKRSFPEDELEDLKRNYGDLAAASGGAEVFAHYAEKEGWMAQLRRDVSKVDHVERSGKRATVETVKGTRYAFRERPNGIWGLTAFTPTLTEEAERAARDLELVEQAAADYARSKGD